MYKASAKDVETLIDNIKHNENVKQLNGIQAPAGYDIGYYSPKNANWAYHFRIVVIDGVHYEILVRFGYIIGARNIWLEE